MDNVATEKNLIDRIFVIEKEIAQLHKQVENEYKKEQRNILLINSLENEINRPDMTAVRRTNINFKLQKAKGELKNVERGRGTLANRLAQRNRALSILKIDLQQLRELGRQADLERLELHQKLNEELERQKELKQELDKKKPVQRTEEYHFFISYSSEDKEDIAKPLVDELKTLGANVWYDEYVLKVGDRLRNSIDDGVKSSSYGVMILSKSFFAKKWTEYEYDLFVSKEMKGSNLILPIWHRVTKDEVQGFSLGLADRIALNTTSYSIADIAKKLFDLIKPI